MDNNFDTIPFCSPKTAITLRIVAFIFTVVLIALNFWGWARRGWALTTFLGPLGMMLLMASYLISRTRFRVYLVLQVIGVALLVADTTLILKRL
ncbi:MAG TPA: hypothetical protein VJ372_25285 [Pyrinomonadaceae bacterium]|jgi:hypothetical protein|nr:hypothetical protein [Pyrinomonadaceae bacterium]